MDVMVITLHDDFDLSELRKTFPRSVVKVQHAVDLRKVDTQTLYDAKLIGESAYTTITSGRKWHWEFNGKGAVGLAHANRLALSKGSNNLLLLEEDFKIKSITRLRDEVDLLNRNASKFDMAVFGAKYHGKHRDLIPVDFMPSGWYYIVKDKFWFLQCAFYSSRGRKKVANLLCKRRLEMQIDSLYALWAELNELTIMIQVRSPTVVQKVTFHSTIQNDVCVLCNVSPSFRFTEATVRKFRFFAWCLPIATVVGLALCYIHKRKTPSVQGRDHPL
jgi:hypothetical protein